MITAIILISVCLLFISSSVGLLRFADPLSRLHATGKIASLAVIILLALNLSDNMSTYMFFKTAILMVLIYFTSAHATHIISNSWLITQQSLNSSSQKELS